MRTLAVLSVLMSLAATLLAAPKTLLNLDRNGLALQGYDPVAFFTDNLPVKGRPEFKTVHQGATYLFASSEHKAAFDKDPAKYEPAFGGYCAYGVSRNKLVGVDVNAFQILGGRLLLQYSKGVRSDFNQDASGNLTKADANWPGLLEKKGQ